MEFIVTIFGVCKLKNESYEVIRLERGNYTGKYRTTVDNLIKQLTIDNSTRKEQYKIVELVDMCQLNGGGIGASGFRRIKEEWIEGAKKAAWPIYNFEHPENGVDY